MTRVADVPVGTIARVRFPAGDGRVYVAEVRTDFGRPAWAGSWHGFTLEPDAELELVEVLRMPPHDHRWLAERDGSLSGRPAYARTCVACGAAGMRCTIAPGELSSDVVQTAP